MNQLLQRIVQGFLNWGYGDTTVLRSFQFSLVHCNPAPVRLLILRHQYLHPAVSFVDLQQVSQQKPGVSSCHCRLVCYSVYDFSWFVLLASFREISEDGDMVSDGLARREVHQRSALQSWFMYITLAQAYQRPILTRLPIQCHVVVCGILTLFGYPISSNVSEYYAGTDSYKQTHYIFCISDVHIDSSKVVQHKISDRITSLDQ